MVDVLGLIRFESKIVHFSILFFFQKRRADNPLQKSKKKKKTSPGEQASLAPRTWAFYQTHDFFICHLFFLLIIIIDSEFTSSYIKVIPIYINFKFKLNKELGGKNLKLFFLYQI